MNSYGTVNLKLGLRKISKFKLYKDRLPVSGVDEAFVAFEVR